LRKKKSRRPGNTPEEIGGAKDISFRFTSKRSWSVFDLFDLGTPLPRLGDKPDDPIKRYSPSREYYEPGQGFITRKRCEEFSRMTIGTGTRAPVRSQ
jgi:hypothetical protein